MQRISKMVGFIYSVPHISCAHSTYLTFTAHICRPNLDYACVVLHPYHLKDIILLEAVQRESYYNRLIHTWLVLDSIAEEPKNRALFHKSMKLSTWIVLLVTFTFWYSAITDLTFGDFYGHFKTENAPFLSLFP